MEDDICRFFTVLFGKNSLITPPQNTIYMQYTHRGAHLARASHTPRTHASSQTMRSPCLLAVFFAVSVWVPVLAAAPDGDPQSATEAVAADEKLAAAQETGKDIEAIDFEFAYEMARRSAQSGASADEAAEVASRVIRGEAVFLPVSSPTDSPNSWMCASNWLADLDAKLLQHQVIRSEGWPEVGDLDSPRLLRLSAPLPIWCQELVEKLAPALGDSPPFRPYACDVYACEPGQRTPPLELGDDKAAILSLGASAALLTAQGDDSDFPDTYPFPATNTMPLEPRSLLLIQRDAEEVAAATVKADARWGHCIHSGGRHLSLVFRSCAKSSK